MRRPVGIISRTFDPESRDRRFTRLFLDAARRPPLDDNFLLHPL